jgi:transketolase
MIASSINPHPESLLQELLPRFKQIITVEAHYVNGGIGSLISEFVAEGGYDCVVTRCGIRTMPDGMNGSLPYLYDRFGISSQALVQKAVALLQKGVSQ